MPKVNGLTRKQTIFIDTYLSTWNATEAARQAGYKGIERTLTVVGYENLRKPLIAEAIKARTDELSEKSETAITESFQLAQKNGFLRARREAEIVYVLREEYGLCKIGKTSDLQRRFRMITTIYPYHIEIVSIIKSKDATRVEQELHRQFSDKRVKGEWFSLSQDDIRWIKSSYVID